MLHLCADETLVAAVIRMLHYIMYYVCHHCTVHSVITKHIQWFIVHQVAIIIYQ